MAREALGYENIALWGHGHGAQIAHIYSARYPDHIDRIFVSGVPAPGQQCAWDAAVIDKQLEHCAERWNQHPDCRRRTSDLLGTVRTVLASLPSEWNKVRIDPGKVRLMTFVNLYNTGTAAQAFDAYVAAAEGDLRGLAYLSYKYDKLIAA